MTYILCTGTDTPETNTWLNLQKIRCAVLWNYLRLLMLKVVPDIYLDPKKNVVPDISRPKKSRRYFDALNEREIGR